MPGMGKIRYTKAELTDLVRANLIRPREKAGLSQSELARRVGTYPSYVNNLESGQRKGLRVGTLAPMAAALGVHPALLFLPQTDGRELMKKLTTDGYRDSVDGADDHLERFRDNPGCS